MFGSATIPSLGISPPILGLDSHFSTLSNVFMIFTDCKLFRQPVDETDSFATPHAVQRLYEY